MKFTATLVSMVSLAISASAHGVIVNVAGANGVNGVGMGVTDLTGDNLRLFNQASRYIKGDTSVCGSQKLDGDSQFPLNREAELRKASQNGLPTPAADGTLTMTLLQVNEDGAGPYRCEVSANALNGFQPIEVITNVPGENGRTEVRDTEFPFVVRVPSDLTCTGTGGSCIVRCKNPNSQPFGGCIPIGSPSGANRRRTRRAPEFSY